MIAVIDYGMGNLRSVEKALQFVGAKTKVTSKAVDLVKCDKLVLPGVGAFGDAMRELNNLRLVEPIKDAISGGKPFLGLCLGMQLLFDGSDEAPGVKGFSVLEGRVKRFKFRSADGLKVPHMGWNAIKRAPGAGTGSRLLTGVPDGTHMYFVHSYYVKPEKKNVGLAITDYGGNFISGVCKENIYGLQFHPEKSQDNGLKILKNFIKIR